MNGPLTGWLHGRRTRYPAVLIELIHVGPERQLTIGNQTMEGVRVAGPFLVNGTHGSVRLPIGAWESGVHAARMTAPGRVGFAPRGAKVFAAGAFTLSGTQARTPAIWRVLDNLWNRLTLEDAG